MNISSVIEADPIKPSPPLRGRGLGEGAWVACWGNATSITNRQAATYGRDLTLRYPIRICFTGSHLRLRFSNETGTEPVRLDEVFVCPADRPEEGVAVTFGGQASLTMPPGQEGTSDAVEIPIQAGQTIWVSIYMAGFTQLNAGTLITGPLSKGEFCYGRHLTDRTLPADLSRSTDWFYFLNTIDILTSPENHALICYGDSITAQSWPDYLALQLWEAGRRDVSVIRRAVSGSRILRQYDCIAYQAYGLKGATRFPVEMNVAGADTVLIQHGINDIIHPVGTDVNPFRPWSDMPTLDDLCRGVEDIYVRHARELGLNVWCGTLLPIQGWRTYNEDRDRLRCAFNDWLRQSPLFDRCIDFDLAVRDQSNPLIFAPGFDSGDHLHPSEAGYEAMARAVL